MSADKDGVEADAFLVEWQRNGETWVHAHADEPTAVDQAHKMGGTCAPLFRTRPTPAQEQGLLEEAEAVLERALIGSQKYLRARVRTAISLIEKARHSSTPTEGAQ